jgi:hypothetical protein
VSTPPSQISIKCGIQHLWTNITTRILLFSPYWLSFSFYSPLKITLNVRVLQIAAKQNGTTLFASIEHSKAIKGPKGPYL